MEGINDNRSLQCASQRSPVSAAVVAGGNSVCGNSCGRIFLGSRPVFSFVPFCFFLLGRNLRRLACAPDAATPDWRRLGTCYSARARGSHANFAAGVDSLSADSHRLPLDLPMDACGRNGQERSVNGEGKIFESFVLQHTCGHLFWYLADTSLLFESLVVNAGQDGGEPVWQTHASYQRTGNGAVCFHSDLCLDRLVHVAGSRMVVHHLRFYFCSFVVFKRTGFRDCCNGHSSKTGTNGPHRCPVAFSRSGQAAAGPGHALVLLRFFAVSDYLVR